MNIAFFCIPAFGHINPTLKVVKELTDAGHRVRYYSHQPFKDMITAVGAEFFGCDTLYTPENLSESTKSTGVPDLADAIGIMVESTLAMDEPICKDLKEFAPDVIVADSMATSGKFAALKLGIPFVSSNTTFAFNKESAKIMKQSKGQAFAMIKAMPRINKYIKRMQEAGYPVKDPISFISGDANAHTIVYTSAEFQPSSDSFSDKFVFVGPSLRDGPVVENDPNETTVYVSMGTVNNKMSDLYKACIEAFTGKPYKVVMSVGKDTDIGALGDIPENIAVFPSVDQLAVLQNTDVFLTHCGMNSVNEALYYNVPLVMRPATPEQGGVAERVRQLGAGIMLLKDDSKSIAAAVETVLGDPSCKQAAARISESFHNAGGAPAAAALILKVAAEGK